MAYAQDVLQEYDILASDRDADTGEIRVNIGDSLTEEGETIGSSMWAADGFFGRPNDPSAEGACRALYHVEGNQQRVIATKDNRFVGAYFDLEEGDRAIVTDGSPKFFIKKATQQVALYTENGGDSTKPMIVDLNGDDGIITLSVSDGTDVGMIQITPTKITLAAGSATVTLDAGMVSLIAAYIGINAGRGNLGVIAGAVPPATSGILYGTSGPTGVPSVNWTISP
jgi:hypothetical protein